MIVYTFAPLYSEYHENVLHQEPKCDGWCFYDGPDSDCGDHHNQVPIGIVNGRKAFRVTTTSNGVRDELDDMPF